MENTGRREAFELWRGMVFGWCLRHTECQFVAITTFILVFKVRHYTVGCVLGKGGRGRGDDFDPGTNHTCTVFFLWCTVFSAGDSCAFLDHRGPFSLL